MDKHTAIELWADLQDYPYWRGISVCLGATSLGAHDPEAVKKAASFLHKWAEALEAVADEGEDERGEEEGEESEDGEGEDSGDTDAG